MRGAKLGWGQFLESTRIGMDVPAVKLQALQLKRDSGIVGEHLSQQVLEQRALHHDGVERKLLLWVVVDALIESQYGGHH